jgi:uncharacterized protein (DUF342 family)
MGSTESFKLDALLDVRREDDDYAATVTVKMTDPATPFMSSDVTDFLRRHSVVFGFDLKKIEEVLSTVRSGPTGTVITVARGKRPVAGKDGHEEYRFRTSLSAGAQTDTRTDFRERGLVNNVRPGKIIAIIEREVPGKIGITVSGEKIKPPPVRCVNAMRAGINVETCVDGTTTTYIAMVAGHARRLFDEIQVTRDFIIEGDLDYTKGNIDFVGNVGISGDVKSGFVIKADGNITIGGSVEPNAVVIAGKSITVGDTIRCGQNGGQVEAGADITARIVLNSHIQAKGNVAIKESISESTVYCLGKFTSAWGVIIGSTIEAIGGIQVNRIGKEDALAKNIIYSGRSLLSEKRLRKIDEELLNLNNEMALLVRKTEIERASGDASANQNERDRLKQIGAARTQHARQIKERIEELESEKNFLRGRNIINREAIMVIKGIIYPTAEIANGTNGFQVIDGQHKPVTLDYRETEDPPLSDN